MDITFDPDKDRINMAQHGVLLALAARLDVLAVIADDRSAGEQRYRPYGTVDGLPYCLAGVYRGGTVRATTQTPVMRAG